MILSIYISCSIYQNQIYEHIGGFHELEDYFFGEEVSFKPDIKLVENTKPKAKVIPFKGKIGAISGDKDE